MRHPRVFRDEEGIWWAVLAHGGWEDATPFATWRDAIEHAEWLFGTAWLYAATFGEASA